MSSKEALSVKDTLTDTESLLTSPTAAMKTFINSATSSRTEPPALRWTLSISLPIAFTDSSGGAGVGTDASFRCCSASSVNARVGPNVGSRVSAAVDSFVGTTVGDFVGIIVGGEFVGPDVVGTSVGRPVGYSLGFSVGPCEGESVGA
jgi:hypothetical protein